MHRNRVFLACVLMLATAACGSGDGAPDARTSGFDAPIRTKRAYVLQRVILPVDREDVDAAKFEFPGSQGPVNKVGALTQVLLGLLEGIDVQGELDAGFAAGLAPQIMVFNSGPLDKIDSGVSYEYAVVIDADDPSDPSNDFTGSGQFRLPDGGALNRVWTGGMLESGSLVAEGSAEMEAPLILPFGTDEEPSVVPGRYTQMRLTITEEMVSGYANNAITLQELHDSVFPSSARYLTQVIQEGLANADTVKNMFDTNNDDMVSVQELIDSPDMAALTTPDVDLDGDGTNDHLSQGIELRAVRAELVD